MSHDPQKVHQYAWRLSVEFPEWTASQCVEAAERILHHAELMAFELDVQADLDALPVVAA